MIRRFFHLAGPFFFSEEKWWARFLAIGVVALTLLQLVVQIRINIWNRDFFNALQNHDWHAFVWQMALYGALALASMATAVFQLYGKQLLQLRWRRWLTSHLIDSWLEGGRHYQLRFIGEGGVENPDQRIAENARGATELAVEFALGILNAAVTVVSFIGILWLLSGTLTVALSGMTLNIPGYMVWATLLYAGVGTVLTYVVGKPIVHANIMQNAAEADFRFMLVRVRENSEGIALIGGEGDEQEGLGLSLSQVVAAGKHLMRVQRNLMWMTSGFGMIGMVYPTLVASPRYFAGVMTLGGLMQITGAFGQVQTGLTWFVGNFPQIAEWRSHVTRLLGFMDTVNTTVEATTEAGDVTRINLVEVPSKQGEEALSFQDLQITLPDGNLVIAEANAKIARGEKVLIAGESGSGKSTLLRAIAGLWPWGSGSILVPIRSKLMFMPQKPYLPVGTLSAAITYPTAPRHFGRKAIEAVLERCGLSELIPRLDEVAQWDRILSGGELQRVAFSRALLHQPEWIFMDEATAALDEEGQTSMMKLFREQLAWTTVVSVAHRTGLAAFHDRTLELVKSDSGARLVVRRRTHDKGLGRPPHAKLHHRLTRSFAARVVPRKAKSAP